ncbi:shikimate kinase [Actinomyces sp. HMT897]|uniref:shikimate kinase n=1 Tax=Actinomyces sp. HMT897 TaxID=2789424 RepID=UPI001FEE68C2|nr:shikimate kinase [Actinomyces sp. HMT897]
MSDPAGGLAALTGAGRGRGGAGDRGVPRETPQDAPRETPQDAPWGALVLIGPPGAGCRSVAAELVAPGARCRDLEAVTAARLAVDPALAHVVVAEEVYRQAEARAAVELLEGARPGDALALGSGCLTSPAVLRALDALRARGGTVVALTAQARALARRNGLDAPRSVALGPVHRTFVTLLRQREALCRDLADAMVDTTGLSASRTAQLVREKVVL